MTAQRAAEWAIVGNALFFLLAFGLRTLLHYRRTGSTGFVGISGNIGSVEWCGGLLFAVAIAAGIGAPILQLAGTLRPYPPLAQPLVQAVGAVLCVIGIAGTLWAQFAMGNSWRIGVDEQVRTSLVACGPFTWVRNPIFSAMSAASSGLALLAPNLLALAALLCLLGALEIQVRLVEEPYLIKMHGNAYRRYAAAVGRFVPGLGRLPMVSAAAAPHINRGKTDYPSTS